MALEFKAWPKIPRLNREMIITEKIDGSNAAVIIEDRGIVTEQYVAHAMEHERNSTYVALSTSEHNVYHLYEVGAQSRNRIITPMNDNFGFAQWVWDNAKPLVRALGPGRHFGEWWGSGIQRGYGLVKGERRFSLFNVQRYGIIEFREFGLDNVDTVPVLYVGPFDQEKVDAFVEELRRDGSLAVLEIGKPRFMKAEGIVVFHVAGNHLFKVLCENDDQPKGAVA